LAGCVYIIFVIFFRVQILMKHIQHSHHLVT